MIHSRRPEPANPERRSVQTGRSAAPVSQWAGPAHRTGARADTKRAAGMRRNYQPWHSGILWYHM